MKKRDRKNLAVVMDEQGKPERKREFDDVVGEREEKRRKGEHDDDDVGEREEKDGPSQYSEFSDDDLDADSSSSDDDLDADSDSSYDDLASDSSDDDLERRLDPQAMKKYSQQIRKSEGFDISYYPGPSMWTHIVPLTGVKESPSAFEDIVDLAKLAIADYNTEHKVAYEFIDLERVNSHVVSGVIYYITFQVKNLKTAGHTPLETFQAKVWRGIKKTKVQLCRPKPIKPLCRPKPIKPQN